jgi:Phage protein (N4 Gp49/phage Sf6 gene 66) family
MTLEEKILEAELRERGLKMLTHDRIDEVIVSEDYHVFPGTTLTVCCLKLRNGFTVTGESVAISLDDPETGKQIAYSNARDKVWALEAYLLRERFDKGEADVNGWALVD